MANAIKGGTVIYRQGDLKAAHMFIVLHGSVQSQVRVRFHIIGNARIKNVGKSQSCLVSKLPIIWKRTRTIVIGITIVASTIPMLT